MSGQRKALIVASDRYEQDGLRNLFAPAADAEALAQVLGDPQIGEFTVHVVQNEPSHVVQAQIEDLFLESQTEDVLLLHFSCHGLKSDSGELFFAAVNTRPNRLGSTAVSADFVQRCMRASRSRSIVLLLDCCYGGAFAQGVTVRASGDVNVLDSFPKERPGGGRGRAVITASTAMEYSFEGEQLTDDQRRRPSLFTAALTEGLATGDADRDEDGWVSLSELYEYVFDKVRERNPHQTPSRQVEMEGDLYLARSRRRRIRAAPIPADLQAAMTDQNMYTRLGAVSELQARLTGDNLPAAAGAYAALRELVNDIRYIAGPAAAALADADVRAARPAVRFGRVEQGAAAPPQLVRLLGPPIARACTPRPSHDWIRVIPSDDGFRVSVDTGRPGLRQGSLEVKGPTGRMVISVEVEVVAAAREAAVAEPGNLSVGDPAQPADVTQAVKAAPPLQAAEPPKVTEAPQITEAADPSLAADPSQAPQVIEALQAERAAASASPQAGPLASGVSAPSFIRRWRCGKDKPSARAAGAIVLAGLLSIEAADSYKPSILSWRITLVLAILGIVISVFEMPPRWPTTIVHLLNSVVFVVLSLVAFRLYAIYWDPGNNPSGLLEITLLGRTIVYGIVAIFAALAVRRTDRDVPSVIGLIAVGLLVIGGALSTVSAYTAPASPDPAGNTVLLGAATASLLSAAALLASRRRKARAADG